ncbi:MAG TPA: sulfite reductase subunit alpha [Pirellulaceae bacterium]|jgi:sulfite reductase (NADPH) flavoprotein alpha-component
MITPYLPETAPFSSPQRAWLNGYFAAIFTGGNESSLGAAQVAFGPPPQSSAAAPAAAEDFPWHDPALPLSERLQLAEGKPHARKLMAAMAQLDCGACGYVCQTYSEAIARGEEKDLTKCSPGGAETAKSLKQLLSIEAASPTSSSSSAPITVAQPTTLISSSRSESTISYTRDNPLSARLVSSTQLTHPEAPKDTRHVVIDLLDSGLKYEPGDSLGILPQNDQDLVSAVLDLLDLTGGETVTLASGKRTSLRHALRCEYSLTRSTPGLFALLAQHVTAPDEKIALEQLLAAGENPLASADLAEILDRFPWARPPLADLLGALARLQPRLYSISSSQRAHPNEIHLTVGVVRFETLGRWRHGVASNFLGVRSLPGDEVRVYLQSSPKFRLPADPSTPIIMIGPGTGIAPFRAFLEERAATAATGKSWLFFGNQHFEYDFLYKNELSQFLDRGALTKLDLAFSRDAAEKIYVQHRMLEQGAELWRWLEEGAQLYVCGDAKRMAIDVNRALQSIAAHHGHLSPDAAQQFTTKLAKDGRYHRDVY